MKTIIKIATFCFALFCITANVNAQSITPQASTGQTIEQDFGLGKISLNYFRPNVKDRKIFGDLVPYGKVWRTGANTATTITFSEDVSMGGQKITAGKYGLFTIPGEKEWTIILNKDAAQWGSYTYNEGEDVLRIKVKSFAVTTKVETFTIQFTNVKAGSLDLSISWENTGVIIPFTVDFDAKVMANIDAAMKTDKKPYFPAAMYYYENNKDLKKALEWATEAEKADAKAPWFKVGKARIQLKMGDKKGANATAKEALAIAKEINNEEYVKLSQDLINISK
jgi:hypothetical protein